MKDSEILFKAAERISDGWCKYVLQDNRGNVCAIGAINAVGIRCANFTDLFKLLAKHMRDIAYDRMSILYTGPNTSYRVRVDSSWAAELVAAWNNHPDTTKEDVLLAFKSAAHELELAGK